MEDQIPEAIPPLMFRSSGDNEVDDVSGLKCMFTAFIFFFHGEFCYRILIVDFPTRSYADRLNCFFDSYAIVRSIDGLNSINKI